MIIAVRQRLSSSWDYLSYWWTPPILTNRHVCQSQLVTSHHMVFFGRRCSLSFHREQQPMIRLSGLSKPFCPMEERSKPGCRIYFGQCLIARIPQPSQPWTACSAIQYQWGCHSVSLSLPFRACEAVIQYELENRRTCSPFHALERGDAVVLLVVDNTLMCSVLPAFVLHKRARTISFCLYAYALSYAYYVHVFAFMQEKRWLCLRLLPSRFNFRWISAALGIAKQAWLCSHLHDLTFVEYRLHSA